MPSDDYVLDNRLSIKNNTILNEYERKISTFNIASLRNKTFKKFDFDTLKRIHKEIFQDVYSWAGTARSVNISKGSSLFCPAENIHLYAQDVFVRLEKENYLKGLPKEQFCHKAAELFGDINALHPFREGNGRTQREFIYHLAKNAGYELDLNKADKDRYMTASIESMTTGSQKMESLMNDLIRPLEKVKKPKVKRKLTLDIKPASGRSQGRSR